MIRSRHVLALLKDRSPLPYEQKEIPPKHNQWKLTQGGTKTELAAAKLKHLRPGPELPLRHCSATFGRPRLGWHGSCVGRVVSGVALKIRFQHRLLRGLRERFNGTEECMTTNQGHDETVDSHYTCSGENNFINHFSDSHWEWKTRNKMEEWLFHVNCSSNEEIIEVQT